MSFEENVYGYVKKYAKDYEIKVYSPIIAQAILESGNGTSELAKNAHNYFGLKYRTNRIDCSIGTYYKIGSEQNSDKTYTSSNMKWYKFSSLEECVKGYFQFINVSNYSNLKGVTNPIEYLELIKKDGYATSLDYVKKLKNVIDKYNLTKYDNEESDKMILNIHAGHNAEGNIGCGAIGLIKESTEARKVKDLVMVKLKALGHTVYDCTVDTGTSQNDVLKKIVEKCNARNVDLDVSIHFNAFNGSADGTEVFVYNSKSKALPYAKKICNEICELGFKNRGVKYSTGLYVLRKTKSPSMLIEVCFVDSAKDVKLYNAEKVANKIVEGITGVSVTTTVPIIPKPTVTTNSNYVYKGIDYSIVFDATFYANKYGDLKNEFGTDKTKLFDHFIKNGMKEFRQASSEFNLLVYMNNSPDLIKEFGTNLEKYYIHYCTYGKNEVRKHK